MSDDPATGHRFRVLAVLAALLLVAPVVFPGTTVADRSSSKGNAGNKAPQAQKPTFPSEDDDGNTAGVQVTPSSGTTRTVDVKVKADDGNGHADVSSCDVTVYKPDNATVHISTFSPSKKTGSGKQATYTGSFNMDYWHAPGTYHVKSVCTDRKSTSHTRWQTFDYLELSSQSMNVTTASFDDGDGSLDPGDVTHDTPVNVSIENTGNVEIDVSFNGTDPTSSASDTINVSRLHLDADQDNNFSTNEWKFKNSKQTVTSFNLTPSSDGTASAKYLLFAIHVPEVPPGTYTGSMTLEAVKST